MTANNLDNSGLVIKFLESQLFTDLKVLGRGAFGDVLAATSPQSKQVAIKIIQKESYSVVENQIWPLLDHPNVLTVLDVMSLPDPEMKLFVSPRLQTSLFRMVHSSEFLSDVRGLDRIRKWMREVLSGLDYLHTAGFAHMDMKSDNVLISSNDLAVICDFSGLAITEMKITRLCAPLEFRPPECWHTIGSKGIHGVPFDMWTYGFMALNVITGHWPQANMTTVEGWSWDTHTRPVLLRVLQESSLYRLMRRALPSVRISYQEASDALHFLLSCMRMNPALRLTAKNAASHHFLQSFSKTTVELSSGDFQSVPSKVRKNVPGTGNPFKNQQPAEMDETATPVVDSKKCDLASGDCFQNEAFNAESHSICVENVPTPNPIVKGEKKKGFKKRVTHWLVKKVRKVLFKKKNYVILSNDTSIYQEK